MIKNVTTDPRIITSALVCLIMVIITTSWWLSPPQKPALGPPVERTLPETVKPVELRQGEPTWMFNVRVHRREHQGLIDHLVNIAHQRGWNPHCEDCSKRIGLTVLREDLVELQELERHPIGWTLERRESPAMTTDPQAGTVPAILTIHTYQRLLNRTFVLTFTATLATICTIVLTAHIILRINEERSRKDRDRPEPAR